IDVPSTPAPTPATQYPTPVEAAGEAEGQFAQAIDLEGIRRTWPRILRRLTKEFPAATAVFQNVNVVALEGKFVVLGFPNEFQLARADKPKSKEAVEKVLIAELGLSGLKVRCVLADAPRDISRAATTGPAELSCGAEPLPIEQPAERPYTNG